MAVPCQKYKMISFASSIIKNSVVFAIGFRARFRIKLMCCIAFGSASNTCC